MKNILKTISYVTIAFIVSATLAFAAINIVPNGGTGVGTITGLVKGNGTSPFTAATAGTDYENPLTFSAPLSRSTNTISIPAATTSTNGYLTSTDWNTFNGKQGALTLTTTGTSGASTLVGNTLNIPQYSAGGGTPAGSSGNVQFNTSGAFAADSNFNWDATNHRLGIGTSSPTSDLDIVNNYPSFKVRNVNSTQFAGAGFTLLNTTSTMANQAGATFYMGINDASATQGFFTLDKTNTTGGGTGHLALWDYNTNRTVLYSNGVGNFILNPTGLLLGGDVGVLPTHTLTIPSTGSTNAMAIYNTTDQTTNYSRLALQQGSNIFTLYTQNGGTATQNGLRVGDGSDYFEDVPAASNASPKFTITRSGDTTASLLNVTSTGNFTGSTSIVQYGERIGFGVNQSSTAGYVGLLINPTETAVGSGIHLPFEIKVGSTDKLTVDNTGLLNFTGGMNSTLTGAAANLFSGQVKIGYDSTTVPMIYAGAGTDTSSWLLTASGGRTMYGYSTNDTYGNEAMVFNAGGGKGIDFLVNGTNSTFLTGTYAMTMLQSGQIGIGVTPSAWLHLPAGLATSGFAPLKFTSGTLQTTPEAGTQEYDGKVFYSTTTAGSRGVATSTQQAVLSSDYTLSTATTTQNVFPTGAATWTLQPSTTYYFQGTYYFTKTSTASTYSIGFLLGGSATITSIGYQSQGTQAAINAFGNTAQNTQWYTTNANSQATGSNTNTGGFITFSGYIRMGTGSGTVSPQIQQSANASTVIKANSFIQFTPMGTDTVQSIGNVS